MSITQKLDWKHYFGIALIVVLVSALLWIRVATQEVDITRIQAPAGAHAMTSDPNSP